MTKKQKQGTSNSRHAYGLHVHWLDYKRMKYLLVYRKDKNIWHKIWGNATYTIETPEEKVPIGVKNKYIEMVQTHGYAQLSMGAATIEGVLNVNTVFELQLLRGADRKARQPTKTTVKETFSMMMINEHKVWICLSTGTNGMMTSYFSSVVPAIKDHVLAFVLCPAAQVYWWLQCRGCLTEDVNCLIWHCFTLSQNQKVTKSKYIKDAGLAVIDQTDANNIINVATTQGIYYLTLGLSDKEKWTMVSGRAHKASAITFNEAREGSMEAHNFSSMASLVTSTHWQNKKTQEAKTVASVKSLANLVFSIGTTTSKVTKDDMDESKEDNSSNGEAEGSKEGGKTIAIKGMGILTGNDITPKAIKTSTGDVNEGMEDTAPRDGTANEKELDDQEDDKDMERAGADFAARVAEASGELADTSGEGTYTPPLVDPLTNDEDCEQYNNSNTTVKPRDDNLSISEYNSDALEVSSGKFEAAHGQKYKEPANFLQALWNKAGPTVGSMNIMLDMLQTEVRGELAGLQADLTKYPQ
jgi:hypothetical protein